MQDCLSNSPIQAVFQLRLVRTELVTKALTGSDPSMEGGMQLVCRYTLYFNRDAGAPRHQFDHILSKSVVHSFATAEAPDGNDKHVTKEYADLLIHLMLFCVAIARKCVSIKAVHPGTASVFRDYDDLSKFDYGGWQDQNPEVDIVSVDSERLENESQSIDASLSHVNAKHFRKLNEEEVETLKMMASMNIIKCLRNMTQGVPPGDLSQLPARP